MNTLTSVESFLPFNVFSSQCCGAITRLAGVLSLSLALTACGGGSHHDHDAPVLVVDGPGNSGHVRYLDTYAADAHRVVFYQDVPGKYEPESVSVWIFPYESSLLVTEHQLDGYTNQISMYTRVVVFDEYATESEMMAWLDNDLEGYAYPVQPESVTWIDNAVSVTDLFYVDSYLYGDVFVDEYEVQYYVDGVSVPGEFVLYGFGDYETVLAQFDL